MTQMFDFFKGLLFRNRCSYLYEYWHVLRDVNGLSKKSGFATFPEILPKLCQFECQK